MLVANIGRILNCDIISIRMSSECYEILAVIFDFSGRKFNALTLFNEGRLYVDGINGSDARGNLFNLR